MPRQPSEMIKVSGVELPKVTSGNTKAQILDAYQAVVAKFKEKAAQQPASPKVAAEKRRRDRGVIEQAEATTVESVIRKVADLKLEVGSALDKLAEQLVSTTEQYAGLRQAIDLGTEQLAEVYDIKMTADALALLINEYETRSEELKLKLGSEKTTLEAEISQTKEAWAAERSNRAATAKERDQALKKAREREKEEYEYSRDLQRQRDSDAYQETKTALEKELADLRMSQEAELAQRERLVAEREDELKRLTAEVATFEKRLDQIVKKSISDAEVRVRAEAKVASELAEQRATAASELAELKIRTLQQSISEKDARIAELQKQVEEGARKVSDIALQAIEGASGSRALKHVNQIALEQAKQGKTE